MAYECQSCYSRFEDNEIGENSLGDRQCPECGGFDIDELDDPDFEDSDPFYDEDGIVGENDEEY